MSSVYSVGNASDLPSPPLRLSCGSCISWSPPSVPSVTKTIASFLFLLTALLFAVSSTHAQSVRWQPNSGTLALNQVSELSLIFEQCDPTGTVSIPAVNGLTFGTPRRSESNSFSLINGNASRTRTLALIYEVQPTDRTTITIPAFNIDTDKGRQRVAAATFEVGEATIGQSGPALRDVATANFSLPSASCWQGQVFDLHYNLNIRGGRPFDAANNLEWDSDPLVTESWSRPQQTQIVQSGQPVAVTTLSTRAFSRTVGTHRLASAKQNVIIATSQDMFGRPTGMRFTITAPAVELTVKPLPTPAPATFNGAVGRFTLDSKIVPATAAVGEPITWTLTLDGTGNWPDIPGLPSRSVSKDFTPITPEAKRVNKEGALFDASITEDVVLIPTKPGRYTLGPVSYTFFNPTTGAYETLTTAPVTVQVTGGTTSVSSTAQGGPTSSDPAADPSSAGIVHSDNAAPGAIPRDPLPSAGTVRGPLSRSALLTALAASVLLPLFVWLALAYRRARATDPTRPQREARIRLSNTLRQLASAEKPETGDLKPETKDSALQVSALKSQVSAHLQAWQRDTAILWRLPQAVPTPASFVPSGSGERERPDSSAPATWSALWSDADRTLYGDAPLPADWIQRATAALATRRAPSFSAFQLFLPRNLLPLVLLAASIALAPSTFAAEPAADAAAATPAADPRAAYAAGDWPAAETAWAEALKTAPTDWTAHHNLALALIQQNRPGEAAGHALAAFVQQPQNPSVRWHLDYAFKSAGASPSGLKPFLTDSPQGALARLASPTRWQAVLIVSAWFAAVALAIGIHSVYTRRRRTALVWSLLSIATVLAAASVLSLHTYGKLADARAVVVLKPTTLRSIPTDLDTQKSTSLRLGTIAITEKTFLGWQRLVFPDGQTGWARSETLVPLWKN